MMIAAARMISPYGARPPSRRAITVGNWPARREVVGQPGRRVEARVGRCRPSANRAVTVISQYPASPSTGWAATAIAVGPAAMTSGTVSVPNTPMETAT